MIGVDASNPNLAVKFQFSGFSENFEDLEPLGNLDLVVVGMQGGKLQVCPYPGEQPISQTLPGPEVLPLISFEEALERALVHESRERPGPVTIGVPHNWSVFTGWRYAHAFEGEDEFCKRTHVFFRIIRQQLPSRNYVRQGRLCNFITVNKGENPYPRGVLKPLRIGKSHRLMVPECYLNQYR
jgi:hypothetical protein